MISAALERIIFDHATSLISPMGQYHYRGLDLPGAGGGFHRSEDGDATMQTGVLLQALAWRYKNGSPSQRHDTLAAINAILSYFKYCQDENGGCLARNLVEADAYELFLPQNKSGSGGYRIPDRAGSHMRYRLTSDGRYQLRWDVSVDAIVHAVAGLTWVRQFVPAMAPRATVIAWNQLQFYSRSCWMIRDGRTLLRYGVHSPSFWNPAGAMIGALLRWLCRGNRTLGPAEQFILRNVRTWVPGLYLSKQTRNQYNNYMLLCGLFALYGAGEKSILPGLRRMIGENEGEGNGLAEAIGALVFDLPRGIFYGSQAMPSRGHPTAWEFSPSPVPLHERTGYNWWEVSPYRRAIRQFVSGIGFQGNHAFLQAYWIY